jgi:hypothetical protein
MSARGTTILHFAKIYLCNCIFTLTAKCNEIHTKLYAFCDISLLSPFSGLRRGNKSGFLSFFRCLFSNWKGGAALMDARDAGQPAQAIFASP